MKKIYFTAIVMLAALASHAQNTAQEFMEQQLNGTFANCSYGAMAIYDNGEVIASVNGDRRLNPASNMKMLSTAAALVTLGADYRWETTLAYRGSIDGGVLDGDLYIIGGGDPMLGSNDRSAEPIATTFESWYRILQEAGINRIEGNIYGDGSWMMGMREEPSWSHDDLGTYYGTCVSGLNFYENSIRFEANSTGMKPGDAFTLQAEYPQAPWMEWSYNCTVGDSGTGDSLYMFYDNNPVTGLVRGTYGPEKHTRIHFRNNHPERSLALEFATWLKQAKGIEISGEAIGISDASDSRAARSLAASMHELGSTKSPSLATVITHTNQDSNNMYAEMLMRTIGMEKSGDSGIEASRKAFADVIAQICGSAPSKARLSIQDGSGLSLKNRFTPSFMCEFLRSMARQDCFATYRNSLVKYSSRCYLKTGSFTGCRCLSGYILPSRPNGRTIIFCVMVNNSEMGVSAIDRQEKLLIDNLARLN